MQDIYRAVGVTCVSSITPYWHGAVKAGVINWGSRISQRAALTVRLSMASYSPYFLKRRFLGNKHGFGHMQTTPGRRLGANAAGGEPDNAGQLRCKLLQTLHETETHVEKCLVNITNAFLQSQCTECTHYQKSRGRKVALAGPSCSQFCLQAVREPAGLSFINKSIQPSPLPDDFGLQRERQVRQDDIGDEVAKAGAEEEGAVGAVAGIHAEHAAKSAEWAGRGTLPRTSPS